MNETKTEKISNQNVVATEVSYKIKIEEQKCERDDDCILITHGCCGCHSGGWNSGIHKQYYDDVVERRKITCAGIGCLTVINEEPICQAT